MQGTVNKFDASSTRFCNICRIEVKLAFGGEANWTIHTSSNEFLHCDAPGYRLTVSVLSGFGGLYFTDYETPVPSILSRIV